MGHSLGSAAVDFLRRLALQERMWRSPTAAECAKIQRRTALEAAAHAKSMELLKRYLTPRQWKSLTIRRYFLVKAQSGRYYRLSNYDKFNNIYKMRPSNRHAEELLCAYLSGVPMGDHLLAQKLMLETQEKKLLRIAR